MQNVRTEPKVQTIVKASNAPFGLIIIGGGPAGLTAGIYAKRAKIDTLLIEKALPGGLITTTDLVENYPGFPDGISGMDLGQKFEEQAKKAGLDIVFGRVTKIELKGSAKIVFTEDTSYSSKAVIIATGGDPIKLGVAGEDKFTGKGVSYCAMCDGPFYKEKKVALVGGGNAAIEEALFLTKYAKLVTVIYKKDKLSADNVLIDRAKTNPKIFFKLHTSVEEIRGNGKVGSLILKDMETGKKSDLEIDGIFIYEGHKANTDFIKDLVKLENGSIVTDDKLSTNVDGIFAAGDVRKKDIWQVITSAADGAIAVNSVKKYLRS